jgi:hypothetical protein
MLVYGDAEQSEAPTLKIAHIRGALACAPKTRGIERHALLVTALIEAGELAQGIADHIFEARGKVDGPAAEADTAMALAVALGRAVDHSWLSGFRRSAPDMHALEAAIAAVAALPLPEAVTVKPPEGFAYYCLYPEAYLAAARALPADGPVEVIGIRSIGTSLAAVVSAALGNAAAPATVRPAGHPFQRAVSLAPELARRWMAGGTRFAIVDEGPGLSGSSFAAVAGFLMERCAVASERIHLLPSHGGEPGASASPNVRQMWRGVRKHVRTFDDLAGEPGALPAHGLAAWVTDLIGEPTVPLVDMSGGGWRRHREWGDAPWPPVNAWQERRKFLLRSASGAWLLKFVGLGRKGRKTFERAAALADAGFVERPCGWRHGFLVEPWRESARPLDPAGGREAILAHLGAYLGFRARAFPAGATQGASTEALFAMARHNIEEGLGGSATARLERWRARLARLEERRRPVETDNRLHLWEWIDTGRIVKTDAVDHHAGHDLIGVQDVAWDVAGAATEFALSDTETERLAGLVERAGGFAVDPDLLAFCRLCYPAFQLGYYEMAKAAASCGVEAARLEAARGRYAQAILIL